MNLIILVSTVRCGFTNPGPSTPPLPPTPTGPSLVVGLLSPTSGELNTVGRQLRQGAIMAFDRWNEGGGINGRPVTWRVYDSGCDYESGQVAAQQAITDGIRFMIGPLCSEAAIGAATVAEAHQVLLIAPTATHPLVTVAGNGETRRTVFRVSHTIPEEGRAAARFARETLVLQRAAVLIPAGDPYARVTAQHFTETFVDQGGQLVYEGQYPPEQVDFRETLTTLIAAGAELIYLPAPATVAHLETNLQALVAPPDLILLGSDKWLAEADLPPNSTLARYITSQLFLAEADPTHQEWTETYKAIYAVAPDTLAVLGYDAANLLAQALQQANSLDADSAATALIRGEFEALTGPIRFDGQHNPLKPIPVLQLTPAGPVLVKTLQ